MPLQDVFIICLTAFVVGGLTLYAGFGLGTMLMPVIALFVPIQTAITVTAVVHFLTNIAKLALVGRHADTHVILRFGLPAFLAASAGAWVLGWLSGLTSVVHYQLLGHQFEVLPVKAVIAVLLLGFVLFELRGSEAALQIERRYLPLGGVVSGFFGGLSGHQGAFRSAFLAKSGLTKHQFLGTSVVVACLVDLSRLVMYSTTLSLQRLGEQSVALLAIVASALLGTVLAARYIENVTMQVIRTLIATLLISIALGLGTGLL
jgi:uncharacterized membrane protein YfcA